jgi:hypothetical protein
MPVQESAHHLDEPLKLLAHNEVPAVLKVNVLAFPPI